MSFKKIRYNTGEEIVETKIRDSSGAEIEKWMVMLSDYIRLSEIIKKKFGLSKSKPSKSNDRDLDWAI